MPLIHTRYGGDSTMDPTRRHRLESLLESYDHPDMWADETLESMYAGRLRIADDWPAGGARDAFGVTVPIPAWARAAVAVRDAGYAPDPERMGR